MLSEKKKIFNRYNSTYREKMPNKRVVKWFSNFKPKLEVTCDDNDN